jgi:hypothetical protein
MGISKTNESNIAIHVVSKEIQLVPDIWNSNFFSRMTQKNCTDSEQLRSNT